MYLLNDIRLGLRNLAKNPGFTAVAVAMLALGIGVNATVFTVTNAVLFKGFPLVERNDRLVYLSNGGCCVSYPDFLDYRAEAKSFQGMGITHGITIMLNDDAGFPENVQSTEVSAETFRLVGSRPILGRDFTAEDDKPGAEPVTILSYGFWERRYGKDPAIVGRKIRTNFTLSTVIGVMPPGFSFPQTVDIWVPLVPTPEVMKRDSRNTWFAFGRLKDGITFESAKTEMEGIAQRLQIAYPVTNRDFHLAVHKFHEFFIGQNAAAIYGSLWGAVGFVLLIACANLANLLLARAMGRAREISVRIALGAGRWRIIRQLLVESVMLSGLGGLAGWWIGKWGVRAFSAAMAEKSSWLIVDYRMDSQVLLYLIAISVATGLLFGLAPALRLSRLDVNSTLKDGGRGSTGGGRTKYLSGLLVTGEMALAVVLLAGAGVMMRSFLKMHTADMGVGTDNMLVASLGLPATRYPQPESWISFYDRLVKRTEAMPGVESVALATSLPSWNVPKFPFEIAGETPVEEQSRPRLSAMVISPNYFRTVGGSLVAGRDFNDADGPGGAPVVLVNQKFAAKYWPGEDPLGKRLRLFEGKTAQPWRTVVGVVSNIIQDDQTRQAFGPVAYVPYRQKPERGRWILVRTRVSLSGFANAFRHEVQALDPDEPVYGPMTLLGRLEGFSDSRFYGTLFLIFATIALLLASIGLYTVIAHSVSQRTQELGIRMAVGARAPDILRLVFRQGMAPLGIGLVLGLAGSFVVNRLLESMLVQVSPTDPITLALSAGVLVVAALLGCWIPARRAMRVDPLVALRYE